MQSNSSDNKFKCFIGNLCSQNAFENQNFSIIIFILLSSSLLGITLIFFIIKKGDAYSFNESDENQLSRLNHNNTNINNNNCNKYNKNNNNTTYTDIERNQSFFSQKISKNISTIVEKSHFNSLSSISDICIVELIFSLLKKALILFFIISKIFEILNLKEEFKYNYLSNEKNKILEYYQDAASRPFIEFEDTKQLYDSVYFSNLNFEKIYSDENTFLLLVKYFIEITSLIAIYCVNQMAFELPEYNKKNIFVMIFFSFYSYYCNRVYTNKSCLLYQNYMIYFCVALLVVFLTVLHSIFNNKHFFSRISML